MFSSRCARSSKRQKLVRLPIIFRYFQIGFLYEYLQITTIRFSYLKRADHTYLVFLFTDHMKKHQRLAEAEMKKKALALELKRERELRRAKEDMYEDKRVIEC